MCLQQELYDGLIHVHNRGLHDYGTPLLELLLQLRATLKKAGKNLPSELEKHVLWANNVYLHSVGEAQKLGYKLLVYIRYMCMCVFNVGLYMSWDRGWNSKN